MKTMLKERVKRLLSILLIIAATFGGLPSGVFASETKPEVTDYTLCNNTSIKFESGKIYRLESNDVYDFMRQYSDDYMNYFEIVLENGLYISGESEYDSNTGRTYYRYDLRNVPEGIYELNGNKTPAIVETRNEQRGQLYIKRIKETENVTVNNISELKTFKMDSGKNYRISKALLYELFKEGNCCKGRENLSSISDVLAFKISYIMEASVMEDGEYLIINLDTVIPDGEYSFCDYFGDVNGIYENNILTLNVSPKTECVEFTISNSSADNYYNYYFSTNKVYKIKKEQFFNVYMSSGDCKHSSVTDVSDVDEFSFASNFNSYYGTEGHLTAKVIPEDPDYIYFDFTKVPHTGIYNFDDDGYGGKQPGGDLKGNEYPTDGGHGIYLELGYYTCGYVFSKEKLDLMTAIPAHLYEGNEFTGGQIYILQENITANDRDVKYTDSFGNLISYNDVKVVDINNTGRDLTDTCTIYHYLSKSAASGLFSSTLLYLGPEYDKYTYLGNMTWGVEGPFDPTVSYVDYVTKEIIHTQNITEGTNNVHYENSDYIGWFKNTGEKIDDTSLTKGEVLYGVPKKIEMTLIDDIDNLITDKTFLNVCNEDYEGFGNQITDYKYSIERTDIFNKDDYSLFPADCRDYVSSVQNPEYIRYGVDEIYTRTLFVVPNKIPVNFYNNDDEKTDGKGYLDLKSYHSINNIIDFTSDSIYYTNNFIYAYCIDGDFLKENPMLVALAYNKDSENYDKHANGILKNTGEDYLFTYERAKNNKVYVGDRQGTGAGCVTGSTNTYTVSAVTHTVYTKSTENSLSETSDTGRLVYAGGGNLYYELGGYGSLKAYQVSKDTKFNLYFKKITDFSELKDFNGKYTNVLFAYRYTSRDMGQGFLYKPGDDSVTFSFNKVMYKNKEWNTKKVFTNVEEYNDWIDTLPYDEDKDSYYMTFSFMGNSSVNNHNALGIFNEDKVGLLKKDGVASSYADENNNFYIEVTSPSNVPFTKEFTTLPLGHTWSDEEWQLLENVDESDFINAENSAELDFGSLEKTDKVYKRLCHRAKDAYELKVIKEQIPDIDVITGTIRGVVRDESKNPVTGVNVIIKNASYESSKDTDDEGIFCFADIEAGEYRLSLVSNNVTISEVDITIAEKSKVNIVSDTGYEILSEITGSDIFLAVSRIKEEKPEPEEKPTEAPTEAPAETEPEEKPTEAPTEAPTETPIETEPEEKPTETPTEAPVEEPTEGPKDLETPPETGDSFNIFRRLLLVIMCLGGLLLLNYKTPHLDDVKAGKYNSK